MVLKKISNRSQVPPNCLLHDFLFEDVVDFKDAIGITSDILLGGTETVIIILVLNNIHFR